MTSGWRRACVENKEKMEEKARLCNDNHEYDLKWLILLLRGRERLPQRNRR